MPSIDFWRNRGAGRPPMPASSAASSSSSGNSGGGGGSNSGWSSRSQRGSSYDREASRGFHDSSNLISQTLVMGLRETITSSCEEKQEPGPLPMPPEELRAAVGALLETIRAGVEKDVRQAVSELRLHAKVDTESRAVIGEAGSIPVLASLLGSYDARAQADAVTALLNLSIHHDNRTAILDLRGAPDAVLEVIRTGRTWEARENAAALLGNLLVVESFREAVGSNSGWLGSLRGLLFDGRPQGKKDALHAVFHLALWPRNRARIVAAGLISPLRIMLGNPREGLVEDTLALLTQVSRCAEGTEAMRDSETISLVVGHMQNGSVQATENAISLLLSLCQTGGARVQSEVRRHRATVLAICRATLTSGSRRGKTRANDLVKVLSGDAPFSPRST